jgi:hypothetical protein
VRSSKYSVGNSEHTKTAIIDARTFLLMAMLDSEQYTVRSIENLRKGISEDAGQEEEAGEFVSDKTDDK